MKQLTSKSYPQTHILNPKFGYTRSDQTDIRATFQRIRDEQAAAAKPSKVRKIR